MKVFLAALSNSIAKALAYLCDDLQLPDFENSEATKKFCLKSLTLNDQVIIHSSIRQDLSEQ